MSRGKFKRPPLRVLAVAASGIWAFYSPVMGQEQDGPGDQRLSFGISQKFGAKDNARLDPTSVGTTLYSDTMLSFGFNSQTQAQTLDFFTSGVARVVDDPLLGTDYGFRDPTVALSYGRDSANSRLSLFADYARPDLAFLDPLKQDNIDDQDFFRGGGTREDFRAGFRLQTGLQSPLGFDIGFDSRRRSYSGSITDPLLFSNQTDTANVAATFRFSPVTQGRLNLYESRYRAEDTSQNKVKTNRFTFDLDHQLSAISTVSLSIGQSEVVETFNLLPGVENVTRGPVGNLYFTRLMPNGVASARIDTTLNERGRQNTLEFGRVFELPAGGLEISFGATNGSSFSARPIGRLNYSLAMPAGEFTAALSRESTISSILSQATETTRADLGYVYAVNDISSLSFNMYYADISLIGNSAPAGDRQRASFYATYTRDVTQDWDFEVGYEYRYFSSTSAGSSQGNSIFFALKRDVNVFR